MKSKLFEGVLGGEVIIVWNVRNPNRMNNQRKLTGEGGGGGRGGGVFFKGNYPSLPRVILIPLQYE